MELSVWKFALIAGHRGHPSAVRGINSLGRLIDIPVCIKTNLADTRPLPLGHLTIAILFDRRHLGCTKNTQ